MSETHKRIYAMDDYDPVAFRRGVESDPVAHEHETYVVQQKLCSEITEETRHEWLLSLYTLQSVRSDNVLLMSIDDAHKIIAISRIRNRIERTTKPPHYNDAWNAVAPRAVLRDPLHHGVRGRVRGGRRVLHVRRLPAAHVGA
jgi:hypothetical protein